MVTIPDNEVRQLRDKVYGYCTDANWQACREHWCQPEQIKWLLEQSQNKQPQ